MAKKKPAAPRVQPTPPAVLEEAKAASAPGSTKSATPRTRNRPPVEPDGGEEEDDTTPRPSDGESAMRFEPWRDAVLVAMTKQVEDFTDEDFAMIDNKALRTWHRQGTTPAQAADWALDDLGF